MLFTWEEEICNLVRKLLAKRLLVRLDGDYMPTDYKELHIVLHVWLLL